MRSSLVSAGFAEDRPARSGSTIALAARFHTGTTMRSSKPVTSRNQGDGTVWFGLPPRAFIPMFEGLRFNHWKTAEGDDGIVTLTLDRANSSVNAISRA